MSAARGGRALSRDRAARIVDSAIELAQTGGFENVRLREVAARAGVALGTLYRHFHSKEDLLVAALEREIDGLERRLDREPPVGDTPLERVHALFEVVTRELCRRPKFARAVLRAAASGDHALAQTVASFHDRVVAAILDALRGRGRAGLERCARSERDRQVAVLLQHVWFSSLVGWSGGLREESSVVDSVCEAAALVLRDEA
ncbi:MAG: TetR/AcrR family transcriptional regulator [Myxococcota bacterium]